MNPHTRDTTGNEHVTDLSAVPVGAQLRVDHPSRLSTTLTVIGAYGQHGWLAQTGLLCHLERQAGNGWDTVLTPMQAKDAAVWLISEPAPTDPPGAAPGSRSFLVVVDEVADALNERQAVDGRCVQRGVITYRTRTNRVWRTRPTRRRDEGGLA